VVPDGGLHAVPTIMAQVAEKGGCDFPLWRAGGDNLALADGAGCWVRTSSGERIMADAVVCTLDLPTAYS
jgi:phytoene desaturase